MFQLYVSLASTLDFMLLHCCACGLARVKKRSRYGLKNLVLSRCQAAELRWVRQREETVKEEGKRKRKGNEMKKEQLGESPNLCEKCPSHFLNASMVKNTQSTRTWLQVVPEPSVTYKCWNVVSNCGHSLELWISQWLIGQFYGF